jgi:long-chain acyl-CoA synthetase
VTSQTTLTSAAGPSESDIEKRIARARTYLGVPFDEASLPFDTVRELGDVQGTRLGGETYLIAYDAGGERVELSYEEFWCRARGLGRWMREELGLSKGDRIATFAHNSLEAATLTFGALHAGLVLVPCNMTEEVERLGFVLRNSEARAVFALEPYLERARGLTREARIGSCVRLSAATNGATAGAEARAARRLPEGATADGLISIPGWEQLRALGQQDHAAATASPSWPYGDEELGRDDEAVIVYTSGTTGAPKGVVLAHGNLIADAAGIAAWHRITAPQRMMCVLPIHHVNGLVVTLITPQVYGGSVVLNPRFQTEHFWRRIAAERVQVVSVVPTLLAFLLERQELADREDRTAFRHIICGAGPLTVELAERFEKCFHVPIMHGYGLSETTCYSSFLPVDLPQAEHERWMRDFGFPSIGVAVPPNEMAIHDTEGCEVEDGQRGEIVIRGHNVMKGYFGRPEANAEAFAHGWFRSGDEGFRRDGYYFITGRIKELIIRGGVNLSPLEIDEVLNRIPGVAAGLAVGFENDWYGEEVGAYVKRTPDASVGEADILRACATALPFHKRPKVVVFGDWIPVTSTGKYQRRKLLDLFAAWKRHQFREGPDGMPQSTPREAESSASGKRARGSVEGA